ncbi:hypothetical protein [Pseudoalteromonas sp. JC3]|uniref:hypothetical protein n=1 Tax=Pseudoalteromonas sp. JC3 TaxID=2810196 RepID=UPI0019D2301B|nr:hypothetical protein [Pseudoalteromonas sp. JC3]MBR8841690.1 hypothetical protein [Pseudoalteromonas sp. JC3]WJE07714.1 hypothetical protein QSH61_12515 [Pseudoalteromonas sp. JC3]
MQKTTELQRETLSKILYGKGVKQLDTSLEVTIISLCDRLGIDLTTYKTSIFHNVSEKIDDYAALRIFLVGLVKNPELLFKLFSHVAQGITNPVPFLKMLENVNDIPLIIRYRLVNHLETL